MLEGWFVVYFETCSYYCFSFEIEFLFSFAQQSLINARLSLKKVFAWSQNRTKLVVISKIRDIGNHDALIVRE
jgi:hypothetical protein